MRRYLITPTGRKPLFESVEEQALNAAHMIKKHSPEMAIALRSGKQDRFHTAAMIYHKLDSDKKTAVSNILKGYSTSAGVLNTSANLHDTIMQHVPKPEGKAWKQWPRTNEFMKGLNLDDHDENALVPHGYHADVDMLENKLHERHAGSHDPLSDAKVLGHKVRGIHKKSWDNATHYAKRAHGVNDPNFLDHRNDMHHETVHDASINSGIPIDFFKHADQHSNYMDNI